MRGDEHYREAERILDHAEDNAEANDAEWHANAMRAAQVHATLAHAAAVIEAADRTSNAIDGGYRTRDLAIRPTPPDDVDGPYPGTPWGRAFHGDRHLTSTTDQEA